MSRAQSAKPELAAESYIEAIYDVWGLKVNPASLSSPASIGAKR